MSSGGKRQEAGGMSSRSKRQEAGGMGLKIKEAGDINQKDYRHNQVSGFCGRTGSSAPTGDD